MNDWQVANGSPLPRASTTRRDRGSPASTSRSRTASARFNDSNRASSGVPPSSERPMMVIKSSGRDFNQRAWLSRINRARPPIVALLSAKNTRSPTAVANMRRKAMVCWPSTAGRAVGQAEPFRVDSSRSARAASAVPGNVDTSCSNNCRANSVCWSDSASSPSWRISSASWLDAGAACPADTGCSASISATTAAAGQRSHHPRPSDQRDILCQNRTRQASRKTLFCAAIGPNLADASRMRWPDRPVADWHREGLAQRGTGAERDWRGLGTRESAHHAAAQHKRQALSPPPIESTLNARLEIFRNRQRWLTCPPVFSTVCARRFWDQHEMSLQTATGRSLPYEIVRTRCAPMPFCAR